MLENTSKYGLHSKLKASKGIGMELSSILLDASRLISMANGYRLYLVSNDERSQELKVRGGF